MRQLAWTITRVVLAGALALPLTMLLLLLVTGFGDPGKQIHLPTPLILPEFLLALVLPSVSAVVFSCSGLKNARPGHANIGALVKCAWLVLLGLFVLDWNWARIGFPPPGEIFLINTANESLT
jgi:hypothetical protein